MSLRKKWTSFEEKSISGKGNEMSKRTWHPGYDFTLRL
jgi:hypothetical protein